MSHKEYTPYWRYLRGEIDKEDYQYPDEKDRRLLDDYFKIVQGVYTNKGRWQGNAKLHEDLLQKVEYLSGVFEQHDVDLQRDAVSQVRQFFEFTFLNENEIVEKINASLSKLFAIEDQTFANAWIVPLKPPHDPSHQIRPRG